MLSDDVAILYDGRLAAHGSSSSLKTQFGEGYTLTLVRSSTAEGAPDVGASPLLAVVQAHVPTARLASASTAEVAICLPREAAPAFPALLRQLEAEGQQLGVASYGVSMTTLEQAFLRVARGAASEAEAGGVGGVGSAEEQQRNFVEVSIAPSHRLHGAALWRQRFGALLAKRALCAARDRAAAFVQVAVPMALVLLALWAGSASARLPWQPPLRLSRAVAMAGRPAVLAASPAVRCNASAALAALVAAYRRQDLRDSNCTSVLRLPYLQPLAGTGASNGRRVVADGWCSCRPSTTLLAHASLFLVRCSRRVFAE